jgi:hypothetical protein
MQIMSVLSRYRVAAIALTLALTLGAMVTTPAVAATTSASPQAQWICEDGCWDWDIEHGCNQEVTCCANGSSGDWFCILW